jgi:hypothetical protein
MARCDQGYLCDVCGVEVESITDSDLYLRYVLGEIPIFELDRQPERHIRCDLALAQYIIDERFEPVVCPGPFNKNELDKEFVLAEESRVTAGWRRLQQIPSLGIAIDQYPLAAGNE